jgi:hypothetical protein
MNMKKAQNVTTRGTERARNAVAVFAFQESLRDITSYKASKKISAPIAMAAPIKI